jgi:hypothetical protein
MPIESRRPHVAGAISSSAPVRHREGMGRRRRRLPPTIFRHWYHPLHDPLVWALGAISALGILWPAIRLAFVR